MKHLKNSYKIVKEFRLCDLKLTYDGFLQSHILKIVLSYYKVNI